MVEPGLNRVLPEYLKFWVMAGREVRAEPGLKPTCEEAGAGDDPVLLVFEAQ